jgi:hypothetical protein
LTFWTKVQREYGIHDSGGCEQLLQICQAIDTVEKLTALIEAEGWMVATKSTRKVHPAVRELTGLRAFIVRSLVTLGIGTEALKPAPGRPPRPTSWLGPEA